MSCMYMFELLYFQTFKSFFLYRHVYVPVTTAWPGHDNMYVNVLLYFFNGYDGLQYHFSSV